jgi:hypothetical protein
LRLLRGAQLQLLREVVLRRTKLLLRQWLLRQWLWLLLWQRRLLPVGRPVWLVRRLRLRQRLLRSQLRM